MLMWSSKMNFRDKFLFLFFFLESINFIQETIFTYMPAHPSNQIQSFCNSINIQYFLFDFPQTLWTQYCQKRKKGAEEGHRLNKKKMGAQRVWRTENILTKVMKKLAFFSIFFHNSLWIESIPKILNREEKSRNGAKETIAKVNNTETTN